MARRCVLMVLVLLAGGCTAEPSAPPHTRSPVKQPSLINDAAPARDVLTVVRDVIDGRTVELADGSKVRVASLAEPADCWAEAALTFARTTLLARPVRFTGITPGEVHLMLEDGTDYALLAVREGVLRAQNVDGGPLVSAESEAAAANRGLWGPSCEGLDLPTPVPAKPSTTTPPRPALPPQPPAPPHPTPTTTTKPPAPPCAVSYRITGQWPGGFQASVNVRNTGPAAFHGWTLRWTFADGQTVKEMWNAQARQSGAAVSAVNAHYNLRIEPGGSVSIGFNGSVRGGNSVPGAFTLNGTACSVE